MTRSRRRKRWAAPIVVVLLAIVNVGFAPAVLAEAPATARVRFTMSDPRIDEASGIGVGVRSPGVIYVQNDSGDTNRFFALDARDGSTVASVTVRGARNVDWEDLAVAPDADGTPSVWLADTGDNDADRDMVEVYRVDEPALHRGSRGLRITTHRAEVWRLRYPGGPVDTESLAVSPTGVAYLVTKSLAGRSQVYRVPATPDSGHVRRLTRVGSIRFTPTGTTDPFGVIGQLTATGASLSTDGTLLAVRTYSDAWLWRVREGDVAATLRGTPTRIALPYQRQGEGVAFDGDRLLVDSEGVRARVWSVRLPGALLRTRTVPGASTPGRGSASASAPAGAISARARSGQSSNGHRLGVTIAFAIALAVIVAACGANRIRVRRGRRSG